MIKFQAQTNKMGMGEWGGEGMDEKSRFGWLGL